MSYTIPTYPTLDLWGSNIRYIDGNSPINGNGLSPSTPMNQFPTTLTPGMAYLLKRGSTLTQRPSRVFVENYIGSYGETDDWANQIGGFFIQSGSRDSVFDDLNIKMYSNDQGTWNAFFHIQVDVPNIYILNSDISGLYTSNRTAKWPNYGIRSGGGNNGLTIYNNRIYNTGTEGSYCHGSNMKFVRNNIFNVNREVWDFPNTFGNGDALIFGYETPNLYVAGNVLDPAKDFTGGNNHYWKHALIYNISNWDTSSQRGMIFEENTLVSPPLDIPGGNALFWQVSREVIFRRNVIDGTLRGTRQGKGIMGGANMHIIEGREDSPYGIRDNHIVKWNSGQATAWSSNQASITSIIESRNVIYNSWNEYINDNGKSAWGSDIDINNFWQTFNINYPHITIPGINGNQNSPQFINSIKDRLNKLKENIIYLRNNRSLTEININLNDILIGDRGYELRGKYNSDVNSLKEELINIKNSLNLNLNITTPIQISEDINKNEFVDIINHNNNQLMDNLDNIKNELI